MTSERSLPQGAFFALSEIAGRTHEKRGPTSVRQRSEELEVLQAAGLVRLVRDPHGSEGVLATKEGLVSAWRMQFNWPLAVLQETERYKSDRGRWPSRADLTSPSPDECLELLRAHDCVKHWVAVRNIDLLEEIASSWALRKRPVTMLVEGEVRDSDWSERPLKELVSDLSQQEWVDISVAERAYGAAAVWALLGMLDLKSSRLLGRRGGGFSERIQITQAGRKMLEQGYPADEPDWSEWDAYLASFPDLMSGQ